MDTIGFLRRNKTLSVTLVFFGVMTAWWLTIFSRGLTEGTENDAFAFTYPIISLFGGIIGLVIAQKWGGFKSYLGRAFGLFSLGLLGQAFGQLAYQITYIVTQDVVPYPSIGDFGFFSTGIFYALGLIQLMKVIGTKVSLKTYSGKITAIIVPILWAGASYFFFLDGYEFDWSQSLTIILDLISPIIDSVYLSLAVLAFLLARNVLGGMMKIPTLFLLISVIAQAVSDFTFLYLEAHYEGWIYPAAFNDYMYLVTYTLATINFIWLGLAFKKIRESK